MVGAAVKRLKNMGIEFAARAGFSIALVLATPVLLVAAVCVVIGTVLNAGWRVWR